MMICVYRMQATSKTVINPFDIKGLYNGVGSVIISTLPACKFIHIFILCIFVYHMCLWITSAALFYLAYENVKAELTPYVNAPISQFTASIIGELLACCAIAPADTIKQRAQIESHQQSSYKVAKKVFSQPTVWTDVRSGYKAVVLRNLPVTAAYFPLYEYIKLKCQLNYNLSVPLSALLSGGLAAIPLAIITTPLDVIKTRIMLGQRSDGNSSGIFKIGLQIVRNEGYKILFKSGFLRATGAAIGAGLELGCYEWTRISFRSSTH